MKTKRWALPAFIIAGAFGLATTSAATDERFGWSSERHSDEQRFTEREWRYMGEDEILGPVPGITEPEPSDMSHGEVRLVQEVLMDEGYDPGRVDGVMDGDTRAAIREFQRDHNLAVSGSIDARTAEALGIRSDLSG